MKHKERKNVRYIFEGEDDDYRRLQTPVSDNIIGQDIDMKEQFMAELMPPNFIDKAEKVELVVLEKSLENSKRHLPVDGSKESEFEKDRQIYDFSAQIKQMGENNKS